MPNFNGLWTSRQQMQARGGNTWPAVPGAPTSPVATAGNASASVAFVAPADTGYPANTIIGYRVTSNPGGFTGTGATSPVTVTGLTNGTAYTFTVAAQNVSGYGPESVASNSVTPALPVYVEDIFSTYLYRGNGATQTITNGINLSGQGGLVWAKWRSGVLGSADHALFDTIRGVSKRLSSNTTDSQSTNNGVSAFEATGFTLGSAGTENTNTALYTSWTFREQTKFFDVVTYTGTGSVQNIAHNLGSVPGCIIIKAFAGTSSETRYWVVYHRSNGETKYQELNSTNSAFTNANYWNNTSPTSTQFTIGSAADLNASGNTFVAYLFAHNAGGFGLTGNDNVVSCGSFTTDGTGAAGNITLGYEAQWLLIKRSDSAGSWNIIDVMRGSSLTSYNYLQPNASTTESNSTSLGQGIFPTATGFFVGTNFPAASATYIYVAIRRPMKVPTLGTSVFSIDTTTAANDVVSTLLFPDMGLFKDRTTVANWFASDRLRGFTNAYFTPTIYTNLANAEATPTTGDTITANGYNNAIYAGGAGVAGNYPLLYSFRRATSFFDEVCYSGTGANQTIAHNLGVIPELIIVKSRSNASTDWLVKPEVNSAKYLQLNDATLMQGPSTAIWSSSNQTASNFYVGFSAATGASGYTYVAYLFATCPGVSKVGSYTGTGATQTIACGFAAGARWVMIKRTDSTGDWYVWDAVRGMVVGTDPSLLLNSTAAEVNTNSVYTITTGFQIVSTAAGINASGGTYIFLAIA